MESLSSFEMTLCSNGNKLAKWSSSALRRSRWRLLGLDLMLSLLEGGLVLWGGTATRIGGGKGELEEGLEEDWRKNCRIGKEIGA